MVVGTNTRPVVKSAKALGMKIVAVDSFGDVDLLEHADVVFSLRSSGLKQPMDPKRPPLFKLAARALETHNVEMILLTSGTEHHPRLIEELGKRAKVIGNSDVASLETCKDKEKLFRVADKLGIACPLTRRVGKLDEALDAAEDIRYPVVLKPAFGGGGIGIRLARSPEAVGRFFKRVLSAGDGESPYVQEYIRGIDASASVLSNGDEARCLTVNEQIIGEKRLGVPRPFSYCGNVVPLGRPKLESRAAEDSKAICEEIGLVGSNGVDFVLAGRPYLIEINPRFQGTIDCVEGVLGINLVEEHIRSCSGELGRYRKPNRFSTKLILYAKKDVKVPNLIGSPDIVDVPRKELTVKKGKPICSVLKFGGSRQKVVADAFGTANRIYRSCKN